MEGMKKGGLKLKHLLGNDRVIIRFISLYVLGLALFFHYIYQYCPSLLEGI